MEKKFKYLFYVIAIILSFFAFSWFKQVNAKSYYTTGYGNNSVIYTYPASSTNIQLGNEYTTANTITYMDLQLVANQDDPVYPDSLIGLNNGTYLYDFYIVSPSGLFSGLGNCYNFTTDFAFYDSNSGSIISGSDRIKSQCVDTHYTYINGVAAYHVLTQFTLAEVGETDPQRFRFRMANYVNGFVGPNAKYRIISGNIQDYDSSIVSDFVNQTQIHLQTEQNNTIINQNTETNNKLDTQIQQNEQAETTRKGIWESLKTALSYINPLSENFFAYKLVELIVNALKSLFIPENMDFVTDFVDALESKLGFIASVPVAIIEFIMDLANATWAEFKSISFPSISIFGYKFWNSQTIDLTEAINIFKPFKYVTDVICVVICAQTLNKWRERFTGGGAGK